MKNTLRFAGTVLSAAAALTTVGLDSTGTAEARPIAPVPLSWPGCPTDHPEGPCRWCPGDPPVQTGNRVTNPVVWDNNVCHTYWYVYFGQGNVAHVTIADVKQSNGVIHVIDTVLLPAS